MLMNYFASRDFCVYANTPPLGCLSPPQKESGGGVLKDYYTLEQKRLIESVLASPVG